MRARLTWAIIITLVILVAITSITRRTRPPQTRKSQATKISAPEITEIHPTLAEITNSMIAFFDPDGIPLVGYVDKGTNGILLFSSPNGASARGETIAPVTKEKVDAYMRLLQARIDVDYAKEEARLAKEKQDKLIEEIRKAEAEEAQRKARESNALMAAKAKEAREKKEEAEAVLRKAAELEAKRIAESNAVVRAAAELAAYRERHIAMNASFDRAVLIVDEKNEQNMALSSFVAESLGKGGAKTTASYFKPAFLKDGLFEDAFTGQSDKLDRLPIAKGVKAILFGRQTISYTPNPQLSDTVTAKLTLRLNAVSADGLRSLSAQTVEAIGAGFDQAEARKAAEERLKTELSNGILLKIDRALPQ